MSKPRKRNLSVEKIVEAAFKVADNGGLDAVSMRSIASLLGVKAMSLYNHVSGKEEILDLIVDEIYGRVTWEPNPRSDWQSDMKARAICMREALKEHPWAVGIINSRENPGFATLKHIDGVLARLKAAGFSMGSVASIFSVLDGYIFGFVMTEKTLPFETEEELAVVAEAIIESFPKELLPNLFDFTKNHVLQPGYSYSKEFLIGLDIVIAGIETLNLK